MNQTSTFDHKTNKYFKIIFSQNAADPIEGGDIHPEFDHGETGENSKQSSKKKKKEKKKSCWCDKISI